MRKRDNKLSKQTAAKTIILEKWVLHRLEQKAIEENTTVSKLINWFIRGIVIGDEEYYRQKAKYHYVKFQEYNYLKEQSGIDKEMKNIL